MTTKQMIQLQKNYSEARNIVNKLHKDKLSAFYMKVYCVGCGRRRERLFGAFSFLRY